jgi:hypothetical protein
MDAVAVSLVTGVVALRAVELTGVLRNGLGGSGCVRAESLERFCICLPQLACEWVVLSSARWLNLAQCAQRDNSTCGHLIRGARMTDDI